MTAPQLIFEAHGHTYRRLSDVLGQDFQGLSQAARTARQAGLITNQMTTKLVRLDTAFVLLRHALSAKNHKLYSQLDSELAGSALAMDGSSSSVSAVAPLSFVESPALPHRVAHFEGLVAHALAGVDLALSREAGLKLLPAAAISFDQYDALTDEVGSDVVNGSDLGDPRDSGLSTDVDDTAKVEFLVLTDMVNQYSDDCGIATSCEGDVCGDVVAAPLSSALTVVDFLGSLAALRGKYYLTHWDLDRVLFHMQEDAGVSISPRHLTKSGF